LFRRLLGRTELRTSLLLGLCCLLIYNANGRAISSGDAFPTRYLPFAIWRHHTIHLDPVAALTAQGRDRFTAFWMVPARDGHLVSLYPVVQPVLLAPLYLPAVAYLHFEGWSDAALDLTARVMEKLCASLLAALSVSLLYLLLRRRTTQRVALLLTLAYAFGTTTWVISSQTLWQHGMAELLIVSLMLLLTAPSTGRRALAAGLLCGLIACNRPPDVLLAAALAAYGLFWAGRRRAALFVGGALLPMVLVLAYNLAVTGYLLGGYGRSGSPAFFYYQPLAGLAGLLFSPTRGLFVFSPFLLFLVLAWRRAPRDERGLLWAATVGIVVQLFAYALTDWRAGISWGPRFLTDVQPLLAWMLVPVVASLRAIARLVFLVATGVAIVIEATGALCYTGATDVPLFAVAIGPDVFKAAWDWRNAPFLASAQHGIAVADLATPMRGNFDALANARGATGEVDVGEEIVASGWALAGDATPGQVAVAIEKRPWVTTQTFFPRPDLRTTRGDASPAGWSVPLSTAGLRPGLYEVSALAWVSPEGEPRLLGRRNLMVREATAPSVLAEASEVGDGVAQTRTRADDSRGIGVERSTAIARLRAHQQPPGFWLTSFTQTTRFQAPHEEMNTFTTALLVDLLAPLQADGALAETLERARRHLGGQIEASGLVRYHGLPDGPGIGTLGCAITPDADDTALVWRIAPGPDARRLDAALATLDRYRTSEGLYRTWLAPRADYQCIDPGSDPNPADVAIQMHVLMLLGGVQPEAAHALCTDLRRTLDDDRIWVYYPRAPLIPMLRIPDLRRAGCELTIPIARTKAPVPGQEIWISAAALLQAAESPGRQPDASDLARVLRTLAADDFARVRSDPPLLYHNDLTASVPRFYWSEDVGYALWLRLADALERRQHVASAP
jgi:hypothetical protein